MKKLISIVLCCLVLLTVSVCVIIDFDSKKIAPIVTEFEKARAKQIASLKEKNPGYIFDADNRAGYVEYLFMFYPGSSMTPEKFIKKYDLKKDFPKAEVKAGYSVVTLKFKRNDYTKAVHNALDKLAKKASSVQIGSPTVYPGSRIKYMPDISLHAENPTKLEYKEPDNDNALSMLDTADDGILDVNRIITTKADFDAYVDLFATSYRFEDDPEALQSIKDQYGEEFFENNALLVTRQILRSDLGYGLDVNSVYLSDNKLYVVIRTTHSEGPAPQALLQKTFYLTVSKDAINNATELITLD